MDRISVGLACIKVLLGSYISITCLRLHTVDSRILRMRPLTFCKHGLVNQSSICKTFPPILTKYSFFKANRQLNGLNFEYNKFQNRQTNFNQKMTIQDKKGFKSMQETKHVTNETRKSKSHGGISKSTLEKPSHIPDGLWAKLELGLHRNRKHPLGIVKNEIERFFVNSKGVKKSVLLSPAFPYTVLDEFNAIIDVEQNFDELLIPYKHPSRSSSDTFYLDSEHLTKVLRTQSTAHQSDLIRKGHKTVIWSAEVVRRDEIDCLHYPIFHQMDGLCIFNKEEALKLWAHYEPKLEKYNKLDKFESKEEAAVVMHLQNVVDDLIDYLLGPETQRRWDYSAYFPFTKPSIELEIYHGGKWIEILGCGAINNKIMQRCQLFEHFGWAFGIGLERLAMILFDIPDIRFFWTDDKRFWSQFETESLHIKFKPYSNHPPVYKDLSFWIPSNFFTGDFLDACRQIGGDLLEAVSLIDQYQHPDGRQSHCYRLTYRSIDSNLTHKSVNELQDKLMSYCTDILKLEIR